MSIRILHIEDDDDIREIAQLALEMSGEYTLRQCSSGAEALEVAPEFAPDLLLMDVMMPQMSGDELLRQLRQMPAFVETPAIFMTARAQPSEVQALKEQGALAVIVKPFDPMTLGDQIREILAGAPQRAAC